MPVSRSRLAYKDCEIFYDAAIEDAKGARLRFDTNGQAEHFRTRLHYFRTIARDDNKVIYPDPNHQLHGRSIYDVLRVSILPDEDGFYWVYAQKYDLDPSEIESLSDTDPITLRE